MFCFVPSTPKTLKPRPSNCRFRLTCSGRIVLPGLFSSTNPAQPPGKRTIRSGTPSKPGDTNFSAIPHMFFAVFTSFLSIIFSFTVSLRSDTGTQNHNFSLYICLRVCALTGFASPFVKAVLNIRGKVVLCRNLVSLTWFSGTDAACRTGADA